MFKSSSCLYWFIVSLSLAEIHTSCSTGMVCSWDFETMTYMQKYTVLYHSFEGMGGIIYPLASACSAGDRGSIPGLGRSPGEGNGKPLQYSCLQNSHRWQPTPYSCLENSHRQRRLMGCSLLRRKESDMTERLSTYIIYNFMLLYEDNFPPHFIEI